MAKRKSIRLKVASPCKASWEGMKGDDSVRHCGQCDKNVYNLSMMSSEAIEALLASRAGERVCGRFFQRSDGTVMTSDCPTGAKKRRRKQMLIGAGAGLLSAIGVAGAVSGPSQTCQVPPADEPVTADVITGKIEAAPEPVVMGQMIEVETTTEPEVVPEPEPEPEPEVIEVKGEIAPPDEPAPIEELQGEIDFAR